MAKSRPLTLQRLEFIRWLFDPKVMFNASEAYRRAYPKAKGGHNRLAVQLMSSNVMKEAIAKKRAEIAKKTGFSIERAQRMYERAYDLGITTRQPASMNGSVTGIARLYGMDKDAGGGEKTVIVISPPPAPALPKPVECKEIEHEV